MYDPDDYEARNRQILLEGAQILERTSQHVDNSQRIAVETETLGTEVLTELGEQRETLLRTRDRLADADQHAGHAKSILRRMANDVIYNKVLLIMLIVLEILILASLSYLKFFK